VLIPLGIVGFVGHNYLHSIPTAGNDLLLIAVLVAVGATLGIAGGFASTASMPSPGPACWP
jgi:hypothetical protein